MASLAAQRPALRHTCRHGIHYGNSGGSHLQYAGGTIPRIALRRNPAALSFRSPTGTAARCSRYSWSAAERRSASVMMFAVSGCFRDGVARVSWEVKARTDWLLRDDPTLPARYAPGHGGRSGHADRFGRVPALCALSLALPFAAGWLSAGPGVPPWPRCCGRGWCASPCCSTSPGASTRHATCPAPGRSPPAVMTAPPTCGPLPRSRSARAGKHAPLRSGGPAVDTATRGGGGQSRLHDANLRVPAPAPLLKDDRQPSAAAGAVPGCSPVRPPA